MQQLLCRRLSLLPSSPALISFLRNPNTSVATAPSPILAKVRAFSRKPTWTPPEEWGEERRASDDQRPGVQKNYVVHINPRKNNTFVTVTDSSGKKKYSASVGSLRLGKGSNVPRFFAEPVAEHAGQQAVKMGIRTAVVKVKGAVYFKKKKDAILSWIKGTRSAGMNQCQITSIQDVTRLAHNGCRLRKKRRI